MKPCFADSYFFFALLSPRDEAHVLATSFNARLRRPLVTTAFMLIEVADGLASTPGRGLFAGFQLRLSGDPRVSIVPPTAKLLQRGVALYDGRRDKGWSLTDCISFVVMQDLSLTDALTADHHFEQAGFRCLLDPMSPHN